MPNRFQPISPGTDPSQQIAQINKNFGELDNENTTKVFYNASGNIGVTQGLLPNNLGEGIVLNDNNGIPLIVMYVDASNHPVLKVANTGQDATTASNDQLAFDSSRRTFQVVGNPLTVNFSLTTGTTASGTTATINHNLGYIPLTESSVSITTDTYSPSRLGTFPVPYFRNVTGGGTLSNVFVQNTYVSVRNVTSTQITYEIGMQGGTFTLAGTITCYIKQITAG